MILGLCLGGALCRGQSALVPRAYLITPIHSNAVTVTYGFNDGAILFEGALPISGARGTINAPVLSYYHSFDMFGHSANITAGLPYAVATFKGTFNGVPTQLYRSGLLDTTFRFSVNLLGGPAMGVREFRSWKQKTILGVSLTVIAPTGQYDPARLINQGANRFAFKPELGYSHRKGHFIFDAYGGAWFYTANSSFYPGHSTQSQQPIGALEGHVSYDVRFRLWFSLDGNYWFGGRTALNSVVNLSTLQANSRVGATASIPLTKHQSVKCSYSYGAFVRYGGNYQSVSLAWQYSWIGKPL